MFVVRLIAAASVATSLAACAGTPETGQGPRENTGTLVGALAGGVIGSQFGSGTAERIAAGIGGAAIGGLMAIVSAPAWMTTTSGAPMRRRCKRSKPESRVWRWRGRTPTRAGMDRLFPVPRISRTDCSAGRTRIRSISMAVRRSRAATLAATRTGPGPRWADRGAIAAAPSCGTSAEFTQVTTNLRKFCECPLPDVAGARVFRRCKRTVRHDVTHGGRARGSTALPFRRIASAMLHSTRRIDL